MNKIIKMMVVLFTSLIIIVGCSNDKAEETDETESNVNQEEVETVDTNDNNNDKEHKQGILAEAEENEDGIPIIKTNEDEDINEDVIEDIFLNDDAPDEYIEKDEYTEQEYKITKEMQYVSDDADDDGEIHLDIAADKYNGSFDYDFYLFYVTTKDVTDYGEYNEEVENENGEVYDDYEEEEARSLMFVGEVENNTDTRLEFDHHFDLIMRDVKEEIISDEDLEIMESPLIGGYEPEFDGEGIFHIPLDFDEKPHDLEFTFSKATAEEDYGFEDGALDLEVDMHEK